MPAQLYPAVNALQLIIDPPTENGQIRDDLSRVKVWYDTVVVDFYPPFGQGVLCYDGDATLNITIPNLDPLKTYNIKYALFSSIDEGEYTISQTYTATPLGGAISVQLTTSAQIFNYSAFGTNPVPSSTTLTAVTKNLTGPVFYQFLIAGQEVGRTTNNTYIYSPQTTYEGMPEQVVVKVRSTFTGWETAVLDNTTVIAQDSISLIGIKPGENGADGTSVSILGSVQTATALPGYPDQYQGDPGDAYIVQDTGHLWIWDDTVWIDAGNIQGPQGNPGINAATVAVYAKGTNSVNPPTPAISGQFSYNFSNSQLTSGNLGVWSTTPPSITKGEYLWARYAVASSNSGTVTVDSSDFSSAVIISIGGIDGTNGVNASWTKYVYVYKYVERANSSTASVVPAAPSGGVFNVDSLQLTTAPDGWSLAQPATTNGTVYVSRNRVAPNNQLTGTITLTSAWETPVAATQLLQNGASYIYDTETHKSAYTPNIGSTTVYTKSDTSGTIPGTPTGGSFTFDIGSGNTTTAPTNWYNTITTLDAQSTAPIQNPVFQSTATITTTGDRLTYTPTWTSPQYQFRSGGQIAPRTIVRTPISASFTAARNWTEVLGSGPQANSANEVAFSSSNGVTVAAGSSASINYSTGGAFTNISTGLSTSITFRGLAASTSYMVLASTTANSTLYVGTLSNGLPTSTWTTVNLSTQVGSSTIAIYSIIKLTGTTGWLAVGDQAGLGRILYCNNNDPRNVSNWALVTNFTWPGTGTLPALRSVAQTYNSSLNERLIVAGGVNGTVISSFATIPTAAFSWNANSGPGIGEILPGTSTLTINSIAACGITSPTRVFSLAFAPENATSSSRVATIVFNSSGVRLSTNEHPTISSGSPTLYITINRLLYSSTFTGLLLAATNRGIFACSPTITGDNTTPAIAANTWRHFSEAIGAGTNNWDSRSIAVNNYGYILTSNNAGFSTSTNTYYYLGIPTAAELQTVFSRTTPQVGDVVTIQFYSGYPSIYQTYTIGLRCTSGGADGSALLAIWTPVAAWIDGDMVVTGSITANSLAVNSIIAEKIQAGSIIAEKIAANAITADKINAGAITATKIFAGAVTTDKIDDNAIVATKIAAGAVTASKIAVNDISSINSRLGNIQGGSFAMGSGIGGFVVHTTTGTNYADFIAYDNKLTGDSPSLPVNTVVWYRNSSTGVVPATISAATQVAWGIGYSASNWIRTSSNTIKFYYSSSTSNNPFIAASKYLTIGTCVRYDGADSVRAIVSDSSYILGMGPLPTNSYIVTVTTPGGESLPDPSTSTPQVYFNAAKYTLTGAGTGVADSYPAGTVFVNNPFNGAVFINNTSTIHIGDLNKNMIFNPNSGLIVNGDLIATSNIQTNAVTVPATSYASGLGATVTITLNVAAPVIIVATFYGQQISWFRPQILRNGSVILNPTGLQSSGGVDPYLPVTITGTDNPGIGTHNYSLSAYYEQYSNRPLSTETSLFVLGAKR